jgi:hypothetical protein
MPYSAAIQGCNTNTGGYTNTNTNTKVRYTITIVIACCSKSVSLIQVTPLGYFTHISITTPIVSALRLEKLLSIELSRGSSSRWRFQKRNGRYAAVSEVKRLKIYNGYISGVDPFSTPLVFCTCFYNHARRLRLEKLL